MSSVMSFWHRSGHCKVLAPKYEQLANLYATNDQVIIAKVNGIENQPLVNAYNVRGYTTLKYFHAGSVDPIEYSGPREVTALASFINEQLSSSA